MKEEKKENGDDVNTEDNEGELPEKRARLDETENDQSITELNGTETSETIEETVDDDVQEIKVDVPVIEIADEDAKTEVETEVANEVSEPEPTKESSAPVVKTTPTRGRGGRGRGSAARRGRSSR